MKKFGIFTVRTIDYVFVCLLSVILISSIVALSGYFDNPIVKSVVIIVSLLFVALFVLFGGKILNRIKGLFRFLNDYSVLKLSIILFVIVLVTKVFCILLFNNDADKVIDMQLYKSFATQLAENHRITEYISPAMQYKYQVIYGLFLSPIVMIFGNDSRVLTSFLSLLFAISTVLLFDIIRNYIGKNKAFLGLILFNLLPVGLLETQLLIHENALLFFYITSFWFLTKFLDKDIKPWKRALSLLVSAILIGFGNKINQGGTVVIISYCIYIVILFTNEKITKERIVRTCTSILCYVICFFVISNACTAFVNNVVVIPRDESKKISNSVNYKVHLGWGLYLGTNTTYNGVWNLEDFEKYEKYKEFDNYEDARNYQMDLINERLQVFKDNPEMIPQHLFNKIKGLWGSPFLPFTYESGNSVNNFVLRGFHGIIYKGIVVASYFVFIILCSIILFSHKKHKNIDIQEYFGPVSQFKMMIIGLTLVLFLFEVMPKYVSHMQIIMFTIGLFSINSFIDNSERLYKSLLKPKR